MPSVTPSQLYARARVLFLLALAAIAAAFAGALLGGRWATAIVLSALVLGAALFVASVFVNRAGDARRRAMERD